MPRPLRAECDFCQMTYDMGEETVLYMHRAQPWFDNIKTQCPCRGCGKHKGRCDRKVRQFLEPVTVGFLLIHNRPASDPVKVIRTRFAPPGVQVEFARTHPLVGDRPLNARHERLIAYWHWLLDKEGYPDV